MNYSEVINELKTILQKRTSNFQEKFDYLIVTLKQEFGITGFEKKFLWGLAEKHKSKIKMACRQSAWLDDLTGTGRKYRIRNKPKQFERNYLTEYGIPTIAWEWDSKDRQKKETTIQDIIERDQGEIIRANEEFRRTHHIIYF